MSEYTPGPWMDDEGVEPWGGIHSTVNGKMLVPHSVPLSPADRALITAAPDLLEACAWLVTLYESAVDGGLDDPDAWTQTITEAKAAIAKAQPEGVES